MTATVRAHESHASVSSFPAPQAACYPGHWVGRFIWDRGESLPCNCYLMFRKTVDVDGDPAAARLLITAALKYKLWVNGRYVASGPARSSPEWKSYDTHDLSGVLRAGPNVIAALCWFTGIPNNYACDERAGLWVQLEHIDAKGRCRIMGSDPTWRVRPARGYRRDVGSHGGVSTEIYDARLDPDDWTALAFDDSGWENACCLQSGEYRCEPEMMASWTYLEPRQTPPMRERGVKAVNVACVGEADASFYGDIPDVVRLISRQDLFPLEHATAEGVERLLVDGESPAVFRQDRQAEPAAPRTNRLAGLPCFVFGPLDRDERLSAADVLDQAPEQVACGARRLERQQGCLSLEGKIDLAPFIGGGAEKAAYVCVPFVIEEGGTWTLAAGADWWMECHVDGERVLDTLATGNLCHPPDLDHRKDFVIAAGRHVLVARVVAGLAGSVLVCGLFSADASGRMRDPFITLDFGRTYNAFPCIEFDAPAGAVIEIACGGERLPDGRVTWCNKPAWSRPARYIAAGGRGCWRVFEPRPVRFLQIVFRNVREPIRVFSAKLIAWEYPAEPRGSFACSDAVLSKLWQAGVETAYLHMDDTLIFDVVRERETYAFIGEAQQGHLALAAGYGDLPFAHWHLKQTLRAQVPSGLFPIVLGSYATRNAGFPKPTTPGKVCNCLLTPNHMASLAHGIRTRYWHFGDRAALKEWYPALIRLADWFMRKSDDSGLLYNLPGQIWFDWVRDQELHGANFENNAIYYAMLDALGQIAAWLDLPEDAEQWRQRAVRVRDALRAMHWNAERGLFADSVVDGRQSAFFTELANGMALFYGIADEEQTRGIVAALTRTKNGCTPVTILYFYYLVEGLIRAGAVDYALQRLSAGNKEMVARSDPPTFWEEWPGFASTHLAGNSPLHFGGAGVVWTLSTRALGVQPAAPGFAACRIRPLCGHLTWARGVVPTVRGDVRVDWRKGGHGFKIGVALPDAMPTEIELPCTPGTDCILIHNGKRYSGRSKINGDDKIACSDTGLVVRVNGGSHTLEVFG